MGEAVGSRLPLYSCCLRAGTVRGVSERGRCCTTWPVAGFCLQIQRQLHQPGLSKQKLGRRAPWKLQTQRAPSLRHLACSSAGIQQISVKHQWNNSSMPVPSEGQCVCGTRLPVGVRVCGSVLCKTNMFPLVCPMSRLQCICALSALSSVAQVWCLVGTHGGLRYWVV